MRYWDKRQEQWIKALEKDETKLLRKMDKFYKRQFVELEKEIGAFYTQYGLDNVFQYNQLMQAMDDEARTMLIERMEEFFATYPELEHLRSIRENVYKLNRLEGLQKNILLQQMEMGVQEQKLLAQHLHDVYARGSRTVFEFLGLGESFSTINHEIMKATINANWTGSGNYSQSIWSNREKLASYINEDLRLAFARGDNTQKIIKQLREKYPNAELRNIKRLIRTEGTYVFNEAQAQGWIDAGFEYYEYSAVLDNRTSEICQNLDGTRFKWEDRKPGTNFPPMHPNCRSSFTLPEMTQDEMMRQLRERNPGKFKND